MKTLSQETIKTEITFIEVYTTDASIGCPGFLFATKMWLRGMFKEYPDFNGCTWKTITPPVLPSETKEGL